MKIADCSRVILLLILTMTLCSSCVSLPQSSRTPEVLKKLDLKTTQAIIVTVKDKKNFKASLNAWQKVEGAWQEILPLMPVVIGRKGLASAEKKREGDGKTPDGLYPLTRAFGYEKEIKTKIKYKQVDGDDLWVDDAESSQYNQWIKAPTEAKSFERLKRDDDLYKYAVVIEYNTQPIVAGRGSAIFMHIWRGPEKATAGCVAIEETNIKKILAWLDSSQYPVIILE